MPGRDLIVSTYAPRLGNGRALRIYTLTRALAAAGPVDLAYLPHGGSEPSDEYREIAGLAFHEVAPSRGARRAAAFVARRLEGVPTHVARACSPEIVRYVDALAAQPGRGRVIAVDFNAMTMLLPLARRRPVVYAAHNVESSFGGTFSSPAVLRSMRRLEKRILRAASESWMVSKLDVGRARELVPEAALRYVPNVVDVSAIEPVAPVRGSHEVLMIGDFTYPPNLLGLRWLVDEVFEQVSERHPDARLRVVGRGLPEERWDERVDLRGFVPDLADAYDGVAAVVVPLTESGGTPLKFIEALAYGVPVVATPLAAQGLEAMPGEHYRAGADAAAFASQLNEVLRDGDAAMGARGRRLVEAEYSVEALVRLVAADGAPSPDGPHGVP